MGNRSSHLQLYKICPMMSEFCSIFAKFLLDSVV
jgi:hypothetical protein